MRPILLLGIFCSSSVALQQQYCAELDPASTSGATGFLSMSIDSDTGQGQYFVSLDLNSFSVSAVDPTCDLSQGLSYHIHSYWNNLEPTSAAGSTDCGSDNTGGHYDPTFACSPSTQASSAECAALSRDATSGYTYNCDYDSKPFTCEVGDLSGKFGKLDNSGLIFTTSTFQKDNYPPYTSAYLQNSPPLSTMWSSIVWHCNGGARLLCAKLNDSPSANCLFPSTSSDSDDGGMYSESNAMTYFICMTVSLVLICTLTIYVGFVYREKFCRGKALLGNEGRSNEK